MITPGSSAVWISNNPGSLLIESALNKLNNVIKVSVVALTIKGSRQNQKLSVKWDLLRLVCPEML